MTDLPSDTAAENAGPSGDQPAPPSSNEALNASDKKIIADKIVVSYPLRRASFGTPGAKGTHIALNGISFALGPGERLGLLGRNGAGKSTLLRTLAGVYPPESGRLEVNGSVTALFNASLGFAQEASGRENIFLRGALLGMDLRDVEEMIPEIIEFSELGDWIDQPIRQYSRGMALRLAFAISTVVRSDIMLFDEWLGAGDASFLKKAQARIQEMVASASILVLATHSMSLMRDQCNRALVLDGGDITYLGDIEEAISIYENLRNTAQI